MKRIFAAVAGALIVVAVKSATIKSDAERIARATKGVKDVNNELTVGRIKR